MSETVDSSPDAIAAMVTRLRECVQDRAYSRVWIADSPALLAQVGRELDEARETIKDLECEIGIRALAARAQKERADAAERQLAEARAELDAYRAAAQYDACMDGPKFKGWNRSQLDRARKITEAREIARGAP